VVYRPEVTLQQSAGELIRIHLAGLVAAPALTPPVADEDPVRDRHQEVVQPLSLRALLEGDVHRASHAAEELDQRRRVRRQDAPGDHAPALLTDRSHGRCLMDIECHILTRPLHEGRSLV